MNEEEETGVPRLVAEIRLAGELLKWKPLVSLDEGLKRILAEDERFRK
jgi:nucleoside-diphosphate-sugar epimerase